VRKAESLIDYDEFVKSRENEWTERRRKKENARDARESCQQKGLPVFRLGSRIKWACDGIHDIFNANDIS
jgi:predicted nucleotidyltransferase